MVGNRSLGVINIYLVKSTPKTIEQLMKQPDVGSRDAFNRINHRFHHALVNY